jgi:molybdopterin-guanine dinucleotide biosynthesis protein A
MSALLLDLPAEIPAYLPILVRTGVAGQAADKLLGRLQQRLEQDGVRLGSAFCRGPGRPGVSVGGSASAGRFLPAPANELLRVLTVQQLLLFDRGSDSALPPLGGPARWPAALRLGPGPDCEDGLAAAEHFVCLAEDDIDRCAAALITWLQNCRRRTLLAGCLLIGGRSLRMGRPKHLIEDANGITWLERTVSIVHPLVSELVLCGAGDIPERLSHLPRLKDLPDIGGPLAGIGAAMRSRPFVSWLVLACDMPGITLTALEWLLGQRCQGTMAIIPRNPQSGRSEPLCAWYDYRCAVLIEDLLAAGEQKISRLCGKDGVARPLIPDELCHCWRNVNRPDEL